MKIKSLEQLIKVSETPVESPFWAERKRKQDEAAAQSRKEFYETLKQISPEYYAKVMADIKAKEEDYAKLREAMRLGREANEKWERQTAFYNRNLQWAREKEKADAEAKAKKDQEDFTANYIASIPPPNVPDVGKAIADSSINTNQNLVTHVAQKNPSAAAQLPAVAPTEDDV